MVFMGGKFTDYDNEVVRGVISRMNENFNLDEKLDELTPQERYVYIGICTGINTMVTMAEHNLQADSAEILNRIFNADLFTWNTGEDSEITEEAVEEAISMVTENLAEAIMEGSNEESVEKSEDTDGE